MVKCKTNLNLKGAIFNNRFSIPALPKQRVEGYGWFSNEETRSFAHSTLGNSNKWVVWLIAMYKETEIFSSVQQWAYASKGWSLAFLWLLSFASSHSNLRAAEDQLFPEARYLRILMKLRQQPRPLPLESTIIFWYQKLGLLAYHFYYLMSYQSIR